MDGLHHSLKPFYNQKRIPSSSFFFKRPQSPFFQKPGKPQKPENAVSIGVHQTAQVLTKTPYLLKTDTALEAATWQFQGDVKSQEITQNTSGLV
jgi:hypothetical protein